MHWATRAGRTTLLAVATALAAALLAIPYVTGVHATPWWEWLALAVGALIGVGIGAATVRLSRPM